MSNAEVIAAIRRRLAEMGQTQEWLGAEIARHEGRDKPYAQSAVGEWLAGRNSMAPPQVFAAERALQLRPGTLSRLVGYLPVTSRSARTVPDAIEGDVKLTDTGRRVLRAVYEELVDGGSDGP